MENIEYKGYTIKVECEDFTTDPRNDWDNATTMVCQHRRYNLGDMHHGMDITGCSSWEEVKQEILDKNEVIAILPLYLYDHSGITMNTTGFSCGFDSGQVGFIFIDEAKAEMIGWTKEYIATLTNGDGPKYKGKTREEILTDFMLSDVETYDNYITGQVYRFTIDNMDGSCGGFFGTDHEKSGLFSNAKSEIDAELAHKLDEKLSRLKSLIKAKVPIEYRH